MTRPTVPADAKPPRAAWGTSTNPAAVKAREQRLAARERRQRRDAEDRRNQQRREAYAEMIERNRERRSEWELQQPGPVTGDELLLLSATSNDAEWNEQLAVMVQARNCRAPSDWTEVGHTLYAQMRDKWRYKS